MLEVEETRSPKSEAWKRVILRVVRGHERGQLDLSLGGPRVCSFNLQHRWISEGRLAGRILGLILYQSTSPRRLGIRAASLMLERRQERKAWKRSIMAANPFRGARRYKNIKDVGPTIRGKNKGWETDVHSAVNGRRITGRRITGLCAFNCLRS